MVKTLAISYAEVFLLSAELKYLEESFLEHNRQSIFETPIKTDTIACENIQNTISFIMVKFDEL